MDGPLLHEQCSVHNDHNAVNGQESPVPLVIQDVDFLNV